MATFKWVPCWSAEVAQEPRVNKASFGDGYEQRQGDGLNTNLETWSLRFQETPDTIQEIKEFLTQMAGVTSFAWMTTEGRLATFVCKSWIRNIDNIGYHTISCKFEEVAERLPYVAGRIKVVSTSAPVGRALSRSVSVGRDIYFLGGFVVSGEQHREVWKYNIITNDWKQLTSAPSAITTDVSCATMYGPAGQAVYYMGNIYVPGMHYNIASDSWDTSDDDMFGYRSMFVGKNNTLYSHTLPGGITTLGRVGNAIASCLTFPLVGIQSPDGMSKLDTLSTIVTNGLSADPDLGRGSAVICGNNIYVFGGSGSGYRLNRMRKYNTSAGSWSQVATSPSGRTCHAMCEYGGAIYMCSGYNGSNLTDLWKYNPINNTWTKLSDNMPALNRHSLVACYGELYLFGGTTNTDSSMPDSNLSNTLYRIS